MEIAGPRGDKVTQSSGNSIWLGNESVGFAMRCTRRISFGVSVDFPFPQMYRKLTATSGTAVRRIYRISSVKRGIIMFVSRECIGSGDFYRIFRSVWRICRRILKERLKDNSTLYKISEHTSQASRVLSMAHICLRSQSRLSVNFLNFHTSDLSDLTRISGDQTSLLYIGGEEKSYVVIILPHSQENFYFSTSRGGDYVIIPIFD